MESPKFLFFWGAYPAVIGSAAGLAFAEMGCGGSPWSPPRPFGNGQSLASANLFHPGAGPRSRNGNTFINKELFHGLSGRGRD